MSDWMTIRVVLTGQAGDSIDRPPGRIMLVHADHAFADLAEAIDTCFGRWDLTPLHQFEVEGRSLLTAGAAGDADDAEESDEVTLGEATLRSGTRFTYVFDLGEGWTHECTVEDIDVDPAELAGEEPDVPVAVYGWGTIPDQYGRLVEDDDEDDEDDQDDQDDDEGEDEGYDDEYDDAFDEDALLEEWDAAESASWQVVDRALADEDEVQRDDVAIRTVISSLQDTDGETWEHEVLWVASGLDREVSGDAAEVWLELAASVVQPEGEVPLDPDAAAAWASLELADWAGAVIELVRSGPGTPTTPDSVIELISRCPEVESDELTEEDEAVILDGLEIVVALWRALGVVDDDDALTRLGQWGLPRALERAWTGD